jgi:hypothetical protein
MNKQTKVILLLLVLVGISWGQTRMWNALKRGDTITIAVVGSSWADSITAQWPRFLATAIDSQFPGHVHLENRGVAGKQFETILSDFIACVSSPNPPATIFVEFHPRDFYPSDMQKYPDTLSYFREHLLSALALGKAQAPNCDIILWLPYQLCQNNFMSNQAQLLDMARSVAVTESIRIADNWQAFSNVCSTPCCPEYSELLYDGSHTTILAASIVETEALNALQDIPRDISPPTSAPGNVRALAISNRSGLVQWNAVADSADPQSGIAGYEIFRNSIHLKFIFGEISNYYIDTSLVELSNYSYTVLALNKQLLRGTISSSSAFVAPADHTAPQLLKVLTNGSSHFSSLVFDEPIEDTAVVARPGSFSVGGCPAIILNAIPQPNGKTVMIETDSILTNKNATITVSGVCDVAHEPNCITSPQTVHVSAGNVALGAYYKVVDLSSSNSAKPFLASLISQTVSFQEGITSPVGGVISYIFQDIGVLSQGLINIQAPGQYCFYLTTNSDSAEFSIGATPTKKLSALHQQDSISYSFQKGMVPFAIAASNRLFHDSLALHLFWSGPGFTRTLIADSLVFHSTGDSQATGQLRIISPASGQVMHPGDSIPIVWNQDSNLGAIQLIFEISFTNGKTWQPILTSAINSKAGAFIWPVPQSFPGVTLPIDSALIRASAYGTNGPFVYSPYFSISSETGAKLRSPLLNPFKGALLIRAISKNRIAISFNALQHGCMKITTLQGRIIVNCRINPGLNTIHALLARGLYLFQILSDDSRSKYLGKIIIAEN